MERFPFIFFYEPYHPNWEFSQRDLVRFPKGYYGKKLIPLHVQPWTDQDEVPSLKNVYRKARNLSIEKSIDAFEILRPFSSVRSPVMSSPGSKRLSSPV